MCWRYLSSRAVARKVLSAQVSLTSVFGMGTGGPSPQSTPTTSIQASYPSLRRKGQSSLIPLYLLSEQNPLRWVFARYICNQVSLKTSLLYNFYRICQVLFYRILAASNPTKWLRAEALSSGINSLTYQERPSTAVANGKGRAVSFSSNDARGIASQ